MNKSDMHLIHAVLEALQVVAWHDRRHLVLDDSLGERQRIGWKRRRLAAAEISEDEPHILARRITLHLHLARESDFLGRLLDALPGAVEFPAMIDATYVIPLDPAEMHHRTPMRAAVIDDLRLTALAAI